MPGMLDKGKSNQAEIAGDDDIATGNAKAIQRAYDTAIMLSEEINAKGWLWEPEARDFLARQEALCAEYEGDYFQHHDHQQKHLKQMRGLVNDIRLWLDKKIQHP